MKNVSRQCQRQNDLLEKSLNLDTFSHIYSKSSQLFVIFGTRNFPWIGNPHIASMSLETPLIHEFIKYSFQFTVWLLGNTIMNSGGFLKKTLQIRDFQEINMKPQISKGGRKLGGFTVILVGTKKLRYEKD